MSAGIYGSRRLCYMSKASRTLAHRQCYMREAFFGFLVPVNSRSPKWTGGRAPKKQKKQKKHRKHEIARKRSALSKINRPFQTGQKSPVQKKTQCSPLSKRTGGLTTTKQKASLWSNTYFTFEAFSRTKSCADFVFVLRKMLTSPKVTITQNHSTKHKIQFRLVAKAVFF